MPVYRHVYPYGIASNNTVKTDASDIADNDYAKFTANGLEGRSYSEVITDISAMPNDGWTAGMGTWAYVSANSITINQDVTTVFSKGDKLKFTQTTIKYFYVIAISAYSGGYTTLTITAGNDYTVANEAITLPYYSHVLIPSGFPEWFDSDAPTFNVATIDDGSGGQPAIQFARFKIYGSTCHCLLQMATGVNVYKATSNIFIRFTTFPTLPAHTLTDVVAIGTGWIGYNDYPATLASGSTSTSLTLISHSSITDNSVISASSCTFQYAY